MIQQENSKDRVCLRPPKLRQGLGTCESLGECPLSKTYKREQAREGDGGQGAGTWSQVKSSLYHILGGDVWSIIASQSYSHLRQGG